MELDKIGKTITETLALQGLFEGSEKELAGRSEQIKANEKEISRLEALMGSNDKAKAERDDLVKKIAEIRKDLDKHLVELEEDNIVLPFGKRGARQVSL